MTGLLGSGARTSYDSQADEGQECQLRNNVAKNTSISLDSVAAFNEGQADSIVCQFPEIWDHWTTESLHATASPASLADLDSLLTPVSQDIFTTTSFPQDSDMRHHEAQSLHQVSNSYLYPLDTCNPSSGASKCSDSGSSYTTSRTDIDHASPEITTGSERDKTEQVQNQPSSADPGTLPTRPQRVDHPGPLDEAWQQLTSGTTDMYRILETIAPKASTPADQQCSCPSLMARLHLVTTYPRLANVCSYGSGAKQTHSSESYPLDLLLFLDGVVYQAASSILSCKACGNDQRAQLNVYLCVDWLTDLARQVLESGLSRLLSAPEPQSQIAGVGRNRAGMEVWQGEHRENDAVENNKAGAEGGKPASDGSTLLLRVGAFQLKGAVWRMCIRELLKHRLMRMSQTLNNIIGRQGEARNALSQNLIRKICHTLEDLDRSETTAAVILAGSSGPPACFSAGFDLTELEILPSDQVAKSLDLLVSTLEKGISAPLIAAVAGIAVGGGCELALACDIIYATRDARFALPEVQLGVMAAGGGIRRLPGAVGAGRAAELLLTGRAWSGCDAVIWGMAAKSFETWDECLENAIICAKAIANNSPEAITVTKRLLRSSQQSPSPELLSMELHEFKNLLESQEHIRRRTAWLSRKK
ncbi:hypothetical protein PspLS_00240 [Pyricularia sp. CBS 133598]|nr:hypothetical protein PspLS_00240 [Pyricularia sp. CBS 133598]